MGHYREYPPSPPGVNSHGFSFKQAFIFMRFVLVLCPFKNKKIQIFGNKSFKKTNVFEDALKREVLLYHDGQTTNES